MDNKKLIKAKIVNINKTFLEVKTSNGIMGIAHVSQISDYYVLNISKLFEQGLNYWFLIIDENKKSKNLKLNWKNLNPRFLRNPFEFKIMETEQGFKNLKQNTINEVGND